jgi:hypothetical protein
MTIVIATRVLQKKYSKFAVLLPARYLMAEFVPTITAAAEVPTEAVYFPTTSVIQSVAVEKSFTAQRTVERALVHRP